MRQKEGSIHHMLRAILKQKKKGLNEYDKGYTQGYQDGVDSLLEYFESKSLKETTHKQPMALEANNHALASKR